MKVEYLSEPVHITARRQQPEEVPPRYQISRNIALALFAIASAIIVGAMMWQVWP